MLKGSEARRCAESEALAIPTDVDELRCTFSAGLAEHHPGSDLEEAFAERTALSTNPSARGGIGLGNHLVMPRWRMALRLLLRRWPA